MRDRRLERTMEEDITAILGAHRLMAIATMMPNGWPQTTLVGYANEGMLIYFIISREGQKFANIQRDQRVAIAISRDYDDPGQIKELSIAAEASEVTDARQREHAIDLLLERRPSMKKLDRPNSGTAAVMRAAMRIVTISDYTKGFGHADVVTLGPAGIVDMQAARPDDWGFRPATEPRDSSDH
jgi:nitroimidazol reductase NimA-like FMN-containing flavoprotein (pyridoxamine 5'-phosphate oxidase superfamily)